MSMLSNYFLRLVKHRCHEFRNLSTDNILAGVHLKKISLPMAVNDFKFHYNAFNGMYWNTNWMPFSDFGYLSFIPKSTVKTPRVVSEKRYFVIRMSATYNALEYSPDFFLSRKNFCICIVRVRPTSPLVVLLCCCMPSVRRLLAVSVSELFKWK